MPAGVFTVLDVALPKIGNGLWDMNSNTWNAVLVGDAQALDKTFDGTSNDGRYSDLTDELPNGAGYTTGGQALTGVTYAQAAGVLTFDADNVTWAAMTATGVKYIVLVNVTDANDGILGFMDLNTADADGIDVAGGDLNVNWNAAGIFTNEQTNA